MSRASANRETIELIAKYFDSSQWRDVVDAVQQRHNNHMHVYVDTALDPRSLAKVVMGFFEQRDWGLYREPDYFAYKPGFVSVYGIFPRDKINFEIFCRLNNEAVLDAMPPLMAERGANVCVWSEADIRRHVNQFQWRELGEKEIAKVREFFSEGEQWRKAREQILDPDIVHVHCNIEGCVHPDLLRKFALEDLKGRGWKIMHCIHSVYNAGGYNQGKIVFLGLEPARTYDIAWYYNSDVLIQANTQDSRMEGHEGTGDAFFVLRGNSLHEEVENRDLIVLDDEQINQVLALTNSQDERSAYSWRFVPRSSP